MDHFKNHQSFQEGHFKNHQKGVILKITKLSKVILKITKVSSSDVHWGKEGHFKNQQSF